MKKKLVIKFAVGSQIAFIAILVDFFCDTSTHFLFIAIPIFFIYIAILSRWFNKSMAKIKEQEQSENIIQNLTDNILES